MSHATLPFHLPKDVEEPQTGSSPAPKRGRVIAIAVLIGLIAAWFAPAFVARSSLRHRLVHAVFPSYPGDVSVGQASLGWIAPIVLEDVELSDVDGRTLLRIDEFRTSKTLFSLLARRSHGLGTLTLAHPQLSVRITTNGSNLEEAVRPLLDEPGSGSSFTLLVTDGEVDWTAVGGDSHVAGLKAVAASIERTASSDDLHFDLKGDVSDREHRGTFALRTERVDVGRPDEQVSCVAQDVPLGALQPWLDRFEANVGITGTASADVVFAIPRADGPWKLDGRVAARRLRIAGPVANEVDSLLIEEVSLAGRAFGNDLRMRVEQAELKSDLINAKGTGSIDLAKWTSSEWLEAVGAMLESDVSLRGTADLARIATALPKSVRLRQPVRSGTLEFSLATSEVASHRRAAMQLTMSELVAGPADNPIVWQKPLAVELGVSTTDAGIVIEQARINSEFLQLTGSGSSSDATLAFSTDLDRLRTLLARFVDLPAGSLAGRAEGQLTAIRKNPDAAIDVTANATIRNWQIAFGNRTWSERELHLESAARVTEVSDEGSIESGHLHLQSVEGDEARLELRSPATWSDLPFGRFAMSARGNSRRWHDRARALNLLPDGPAWSIDGDLEASGEIDANDKHIRATKVAVDAKQFRLVTPSQTFDESYLRFTGNLSWDRVASELTSATSKLDCESAAIDMQNLRWSLERMVPLAGHYELRGGIGRLARYMLPARPPVWFSGVIAGTVNVKGDQDATSFDAAFDFERPLVTTPTAGTVGAVTWVPAWSDDTARVTLAGRYHTLSDALDVSAFETTSSGLKLTGKGRVDGLSQAASTDLSGTIVYDLQELAKRIPAWPPDVVARGQGSQPFAVRGPLLSVEGIDPALLAESRVTWDTLDIWGMNIGRGELAAHLDRKSLTLGPFESVVSKGRVRASATMPLSSPWPLRVSPGKIVENIELTPELARQWLRYATPLLADSTTVQGKASMGVASCVVPLVSPSATEAEATLHLENLDATAGPVARSLIDIVAQVQRIAGKEGTSGSDLHLVAPQQSVALRMTNARVFHDRFAVRLGDADGPTITTSGSVGVDETLDLVVTVPLDAKWFRDERVAQALGGQLLRIPVRGTLSKPAPDPRALQDFARRAATGAVNGFLNRELEKQLGDPLKKLLDR